MLKNPIPYLTPIHFNLRAVDEGNLFWSNHHIQKTWNITRAGKVTFKMYFTTDYKIHALKSNQ